MLNDEIEPQAKRYAVMFREGPPRDYAGTNGETYLE